MVARSFTKETKRKYAYHVLNTQRYGLSVQRSANIRRKREMRRISKRKKKKKQKREKERKKGTDR